MIPLVVFISSRRSAAYRSTTRSGASSREIPNVVAVKIAPFDRYRTIDVVRAIGASGRDDIALYTGNDDNIVSDLVTPFPFGAGGAADAGSLVAC